jgi:hypothetical protein
LRLLSRRVHIFGSTPETSQGCLRDAFLCIAGVAASALLATAGCGGGGGISKADFIDSAETICAGANERAAGLGPEPQILTPRHAAWVLRVTAINRRAVRELRRLDVPEAGRRQIAAMLRAYERGFSRGEEIARASRAGNDRAFRSAVAAALDGITMGNLVAAGYGLADCASLGRVG